MSELPPHDFEAGNRVTVTAGPFHGMTGTVIDPGESVEYRLLRIELWIFGRPVPVELQPSEVRRACWKEREKSGGQNQF
jgi:transcription antitermination factor NusG